MKSLCRSLAMSTVVLAASAWPGVAQASDASSATVGTFLQEVHTAYTTAQGLPDNNVLSVVVAPDNSVYAGTAKGAARFADGKWSVVTGVPEKPVVALAAQGDRLLMIVDGALRAWNGSSLAQEALLPTLGEDAACVLAVRGDTILLGTDSGLFRLKGKKFSLDSGLQKLLKDGAAVRQIAIGPNGTVYVATKSGLFAAKAAEGWKALIPEGAPHFADVNQGAVWAKQIKSADGTVKTFPKDEPKRWALTDVRGVAVDGTGRLWFAAPQGAGCLTGNAWAVYTGQEGLPYNDFTGAAPAEDGAVWFGTHFGAIKYDGTHWAYRQGRRWLCDDDVRAVAVTQEGNAWFATAQGVSVIERKPMTLAEKARHYEDLIDKCNRRTPWGFVLEARVDAPGDASHATQSDSDNDGLWTAMYGAGECFAYGATKDPKAKERAKQAFEALHWLGQVTQGGTHPAPKGYVARSILPTSGPDPNIGRLEGDKKTKATEDALWKVYEPRWPVSEDGKWYWKSDTSSDELDGHYFFYPLYYDLVAETEEEKAEVRKHVKALTDHLVEHDFNLVDIDGTPTRWGVYEPEELNHNPYWFSERGLKSLSILSYLAAAEHITGDPKYGKAAKMLCKKHAFDTNAMVSKIQYGIGSGNQSDDEMGLMCFYNLIKYTKDPVLRSRMTYALRERWILEAPEKNPFFNFVCAAMCNGTEFKSPWGTYAITLWDGWLQDSVDTLLRFPLDRFNWGHSNIQRLDIVPLPRQAYETLEERMPPRCMKVDGTVIPVDECFFNHWNRDPYEVNSGGDGREIADGAVFTLPYYMGLYHKFIVESPGK